MGELVPEYLGRSGFLVVVVVVVVVVIMIGVVEVPTSMSKMLSFMT